MNIYLFVKGRQGKNPGVSDEGYFAIIISPAVGLPACCCVFGIPLSFLFEYARHASRESGPQTVCMLYLWEL